VCAYDRRDLPNPLDQHLAGQQLRADAHHCRRAARVGLQHLGHTGAGDDHAVYLDSHHRDSAHRSPHKKSRQCISATGGRPSCYLVISTQQYREGIAMDYQKLLFAAAVRDLASGIKNSEAGAYWQSLRDVEDPDRDAKRTEWVASHPLVEFVPEALRRIQEVADLIP
jgi:hypothetical protein